MTTTLLASIFVTMIALLIYAAGTFDGRLFLYVYVGGTWLVTMILIERDVRAQPAQRLDAAE